MDDSDDRAHTGRKQHRGGSQGTALAREGKTDDRRKVYGENHDPAGVVGYSPPGVTRMVVKPSNG